MNKLATVALVFLAVLATFTFGSGTAHADGLIAIDCPSPVPPCPSCPLPLTPPQVEPGFVPPCIFGLPCPTPPRLRPQPNCAAYLAVKNHNVTVTIDNQLAKTHVDEIFVNDSDSQLEGTYIFPLPDDAAISDFAMYVDGQRLEGKVLDREQARQIYEEIVRRRRDPALLEYIGRNAFQARIFPIAPHSEKRVEISYAQVLKQENGLVKYVYPLSTEKFSSRPLESVGINVSIKSAVALKAIYSPSHSVSVARQDDYNANVGYEAANVKPDRDFILYYSTSSKEVDATLLTYQPDAGASADGFFLLLLTPRVQVDVNQVVAKDVILVLDTSGSMQGEKIEQARNALKYVLDQLKPDDRFNIVSFSTGVVPYASSLQPASARGDAKRFVEKLDASGSTDINRALLEALADADRERPTIVIFLTDGLPTVGETNVEQIVANVDRAAPSNVRLFSFGVGDDVNTLLLDSLSEKHRGASAYVRPGESIDEAVSGFYAKVSTPVLTDLNIDWGAMQVRDVYPYPLPDLFAGSQLVLAGRYHGSGPGAITLRGKVNGASQTFKFEDLTFAASGGDKFIAPLWARRKIGYLLSQIRLNGENKEAVDEIVSLAKRYGIVTPYTSFLIQEPLPATGGGGGGGGVVVPSTAGGGGGGGAAQATAAPQATTAPAAAPTSGATAVANSQANRALQDANTASGESNDQVKQIGDKVFILRNGVWTDTSFDPDKMVTTKVQFGSAAYFDLLTQHPEWSAYLAVGDRVIFVVDGNAYEVTS